MIILNRISVLMMLVLATLLSSGSQACIWDRDTLAMEARHFPGIMDVIAGRFERNPPLYYEMRLERVSDQITREPGNLGAYDDAGVACDRLGRDDEAIVWMEKKSKQLDKLNPAASETREHHYRYLANLGTFHAHRWFHSGGDRAKMDDLLAARELIKQAITLNPDAHFGREKYQLMAIEWLINPPKIEQSERWSFVGNIQESQAPEAVKGISGLIVLGAAWQSVDAYLALSESLATNGQRKLAGIAWQRAWELVDAGGHSKHPGAPKDAEEFNEARPTHGYLADTEYFLRARAAANQWHEQRTAFMLAKLQKGSHPDTHADFWDGYVDGPELPEIPGGKISDYVSVYSRRYGGLLVLAPIVCLIAVLIWRQIRRTAKNKPA